MRHANANPFTDRERLRDLLARARAAAARKDWRENHRLCRLHDELALALGVPGPMWEYPSNRR